ncbi:hypothetical protein PHLCEN_2v2746 [Hermanssonia centrifuga]|uniref:Dimeric alpha-beta barrel n=1 Tax=Hermanssonia centrifuga TaxID=98765 RepID=A0A2R6RHX4_9APHY|nr:hypothetical protein PHLCEN_2v2746 [Hermanssonia centrifuga]
MAPPAYLLVFSDHGTGVSEEEFTDWYDNEHVPLRVAVPAFQTLTRWVAADGKSPHWGASYDLTSYEATQNPPYNTLVATRSEREKRIVQEAEILDRRTYELWEGPLPSPSALFDKTKSAPFTVFVSIDVKPEAEDDYNKWYDEEHIPLLSKVPGWIRSRRFILKDSGKLGVVGKTDQSPAPKYLAVHEWASLDGKDSEEYKHAVSTPWRERVVKDVVAYERRVFKFYKSWEGN